jgi:hypothetical protein
VGEALQQAERAQQVKAAPVLRRAAVKAVAVRAAAKAAVAENKKLNFSESIEFRNKISCFKERAPGAYVV